MKCPKCGKIITDDSRFCEFCGEKIYSLFHPYYARLDLENKKWLGVCAGTGKSYAVNYGWDQKTWTAVKRIEFILLGCFFGVGLVIYFLCYAILRDRG